MCADCCRELLDPNDRRHGYPFTNCTNCGPRFTIIESLPYDRERTTMRHFPLCSACRREYEDPTDRRFHAEPNACPDCGPRAVLLGGADLAAGVARELDSARAPAVATLDDVLARGDDRGATELSDDLLVLSRSDRQHPDAAVRRAAELLCQGRILALKGLGGFHLACDATDHDAVRELKRRKGRPHKPLAVMFADLEQVREHCAVSAAEAELLVSPEHPIVLLEWRAVGPRGEPCDEVGGGSPSGTAISSEVAVRQRYLGVMLPYTPLHLLLLRAAGRPLVMTSGNLAEEPIVTSWRETSRVAAVPDAYLVHDRRIHARYDDSVALVRRGVPRLVRRSRGYAPFPVPLPRALPQTLACGAELKNTFCLTRDAHAFVSQHIGDLENLETLEHFEESIRLYRALFRLEPRAIAFDLHPEYLATKYAMEQLDHQPLQGFGVQHHHAHVVACMAENGYLEAPVGESATTRLRQVIGVSLDGLGFGADGNLWGGELLIADAVGYRRVAHLEYLPLPGGELAIRRPARTGAGWLAALLGAEAVQLARRCGLDLGDREAAAVIEQVRRGVNAPLTSSAGRLFDCVAALSGLRAAITYEGQAAIELEMVSSAGARPYRYIVDGDPTAALGVPLRAPAGAPGPVDDDRAAATEGPLVVRLRALLEGALQDIAAGATPAVVGSRLHATLAALVLDLCRRLREVAGLDVVALSGGVFQNRLLTDLCQDSLERDGFRVLTHALVPTNDGGLSLGQAVVTGYNLLIEGGRQSLPAARSTGS
jgi:hydrogenase maturation protein HypF